MPTTTSPLMPPLPDVCAIVMAAGLGTRMRSEVAKVLHPLGDRPMLAYVLGVAQRLGLKRTLVVVGHQADRVREAVAAFPVEFVTQAEQRGTAHAVLQAEPALRDFEGEVLVLTGDVPLLSDALVLRLVEERRKARADAALVTTRLENPRGYGRILRDARRDFRGIVEEPEATAAQRRVKEINAGLYCFRAPALFRALCQVQPSAVKRELYLPDVPGIIRKGRGRVVAVVAEDAHEVLGINTRAELAEAAAILRRRTVTRLMECGVTCVDPAAVYVAPDACIGPDTTLYPNVQIDGRSRVGKGCTIHAGARLQGAQLGDHVTVLDGCVVIDSEVADECVLGPYAHLRPGNRLRRKVKIGNFVEAKKVVVGEGSKVPHLTYVGDTVIGERVNVGAGTITCNYDGFGKHQTVIEDGAFIGSNTSLVAPVKIGAGAIVGAGSTITDEVPADALALARGRQVNKEGRAAEIRHAKAAAKGEKGQH